MEAAQRPGFSGAAPIDRESGRAESRFQNRNDLARREAASAATRCWAAAFGAIIKKLSKILRAVKGSIRFSIVVKYSPDEAG